MATPLTAAHRSWRTKIFASTWIAYVGFYFCRKPFSATKGAIGAEAGWTATDLANIYAAYLFAYALGQFLASWLGTRLGARRNVMIGMALSIAVTIGMGTVLSFPAMVGFAAVLGLSQATGWSGTVGTMAAWFHKHERGKVMGAWSTNFTVGSIASGWAAWAVLRIRDPGEAAPWRLVFYLGAGVLTLVLIQFYFLQRNKPEDVGLSPIDDPVTVEDEAKLPDPPGLGLSRTAWTNLLLVAGFYFFIKFIRYAVWSWSSYFLTENYKLSTDMAALYATLFDVFGIAGVFATGYLSDKYFASRRAGISLIFLIGMMCTTMLLVQFGDRGPVTFALLLGAVGFTLYGPDALLTGAGAIDIGGRKAALFATAMISGFGSIGPIIQEVVIGRMYDAKQGELGPIFELIFTCAIAATAFVAILVWRNRGGKGV